MVEESRNSAIRSAAVMLLGMLYLGLWIRADAEIIETPVTGAFNRSQENGCYLISVFYYRVDCSYSNRRKTFKDKPIPWVGPTANVVYYSPDSPHALPDYTPKPGDDRVALTLNGYISVNDRGTESGADDTIAGTWQVGPAARSVTTRTGQDGGLVRVVESWQRVDHMMPATPVDSAVPNDLGGFDYVIGSKGFPQRICRKKDSEDCFPSVEAPWLTDGKWGVDVWEMPSDLPIAREPAMGGNQGSRTTAVFEDYRCIDYASGTECARGVGLWSGLEDPGVDNLLLKLTTDARGRVIQAQGFWTNEFRLGAGPKSLRTPDGGDDSWLGGYLELTGMP